VLLWLGRLAFDDRRKVRLRVAAAVGHLGTVNFTAVYRSVLRPWAESRNFKARETAAQALEFIAADTSMTARVKRQIQDWCLSPNIYLNDTAARAYGTEIGRIDAREALSSLHFLALRPEQTRFDSIPDAVAQIFCARNDPAVLAALAEWVEPPPEGSRRSRRAERPPRAQAARAVLYLAHIAAPNDEWPALLRLAQRSGEQAQHLTTSWRQALGEALTARRAWEVLAAWLVRADSIGGDLRDATVGFAGAVFADGALRSRALNFYLGIWRSEHGDLDVWKRLETTINEGTP
jgi:hypothetical protein